MSSATILLGILIILLIANLFVVLYVVRLVQGAGNAAAEKGFGFLQKEIQNLRSSFDTKIGESTKEIHASVRQQLGESNKIVQDVTERLTQLGETNKQVVSFAEQLRQLQDVLQNPKQRGVLGEYYLETVLQNVLPPKSYKMQYAFSNGEVVDAVVLIRDRVVPIDSKFSLENYNRLLDTNDPSEKTRLEKLFKSDLKSRIDETSKYVRPSEGTTEFAFMFVPSEGLYYDVLVGSVGTGVAARDLIEYAFTKKVIIVSPTSFLAYLQTVLQGLKALEIEESAKDIRKRVEELGRHLGKYGEFHGKMGMALQTVSNHYNNAGKEFKKIDKDVTRITGESPQLSAESVEGPDLDT